MNPITLRAEDPPNNTIVVVRGGEMTAEFVHRSALAAHDEIGIYALSVFLALDDSLVELCRREPFLSRYGKVRLSRVALLRGAGFALIPTLGRPHYDIVLPDLSHSTLERLDGCFESSVPNPGRA